MRHNATIFPRYWTDYNPGFIRTALRRGFSHCQPSLYSYACEGPGVRVQNLHDLWPL